MWLNHHILVQEQLQQNNGMLSMLVCAIHSVLRSFAMVSYATCSFAMPHAPCCSRLDEHVKGGFYRMEGGRDWEHEARHVHSDSPLLVQ